MANRTPKAKRGVGPGKIIISVYFDANLHTKVKKRAVEQARSLSNYLRTLAERDVCGAKGSPSFKEAEPQEVGLAA